MYPRTLRRPSAPDKNHTAPGRPAEPDRYRWLPYAPADGPSVPAAADISWCTSPAPASLWEAPPFYTGPPWQYNAPAPLPQNIPETSPRSDRRYRYTASGYKPGTEYTRSRCRPRRSAPPEPRIPSEFLILIPNVFSYAHSCFHSFRSRRSMYSILMYFDTPSFLPSS